jgi:hypothetical protein
MRTVGGLTEGVRITFPLARCMLFSCAFACVASCYSCPLCKMGKNLTCIPTLHLCSPSPFPVSWFVVTTHFA